MDFSNSTYRSRRPIYMDPRTDLRSLVSQTPDNILRQVLMRELGQREIDHSRPLENDEDLIETRLREVERDAADVVSSMAIWRMRRREELLMQLEREEALRLQSVLRAEMPFDRDVRYVTPRQHDLSVAVARHDDFEQLQCQEDIAITGKALDQLRCHEALAGTRRSPLLEEVQSFKTQRDDEAGNKENEPPVKRSRHDSDDSSVEKRASSTTVEYSVSQEQKWDQRFQELLAYKSVYGNCNVPEKYHDNPQLGAWVRYQRKQFRLRSEKKTSRMTPEHEMALEKVGFVWCKRDVVSWEGRLQELEEYKTKYGNCLVPTKFGRLGAWVTTQRSHYRLLKEGKPSIMNGNRMAALDRLGFVWSLKKNARN